MKWMVRVGTALPYKLLQSDNATEAYTLGDQWSAKPAKPSARLTNVQPEESAVGTWGGIQLPLTALLDAAKLPN
jgi:hypothetical protein